MSKSVRLVTAIGILVLALVAGIYLVQRARTSTTTDQGGAPVSVWTPSRGAPSAGNSPSVSTSALPTPPSSSAKPSATSTSTRSGSQPATQTTAAPSKARNGAVPEGCSPTLEPISPTKFRIDSMDVTSQMLALGDDSSGVPAAPPLSDSRSVGWWTNGPKVGSSQGHAILTVHTYRNGGALGNQLYSKQGLKEGDLVRMTDDQGTTQCYRMEKALKIWVKDYDPKSDVLYTSEGAPRAVLVICWDFNWGTEEWDSRILFYLAPVAA